MKWSNWGLHYPISDPHNIWSCFTKCHQYPMYLAFIPLSIPYWLKPCGRRYANLLSPHLECAKIEANLSDNGVVETPSYGGFSPGKWWLDGIGFSMVFQTPIGMPWYAHLRFQRDRVRCYMRWGTFYFEEFRHEAFDGEKDAKRCCFFPSNFFDYPSQTMDILWSYFKI